MSLKEAKEKWGVKKMGRPRKPFLQEYIPLLENHMAEGLSLESFAAIVHVCKDTVYLWMSEHQDFFDAAQRGREKCRLYWEKLGRDYVITESTHGVGSKSLNSTVWLQNMRCRFADEWSETTKVEQKTEVSFANVSDAELEKMVQEYVQETSPKPIQAPPKTKAIKKGPTFKKPRK